MQDSYLLDTNTVSYIARGKSAAARVRLAEFADNRQLCLSVICEAEIRYGLAKRPEASALNQAIRAMLLRLDVLAWGTAESIIYGRVRAGLEAAGKTLSSMDMLIAAHAISVEGILVTADGAFQQVPGLKIENWATDI